MGHKALKAIATGFGGALSAFYFACLAALAEPVACVLPDHDAGRILFAENCTVCHGLDGKGGGPVAQALELAPPDLTALAGKSGAFPSTHVLEILKNGAGETGDGGKTMPMWAKIFSHECGEVYGEQAIASIKLYIEEIQAKRSAGEAAEK